MFTYKIKSSGQRCRKAVWWPTTDKPYISQDTRWPLMVLESGQITKVRVTNLKKLD